MISRNEIAGRVEELARTIGARHGVEIVEVLFVSEGGRWCLRVFMDKPRGVDLKDCETISRDLDRVLDEEDFIPYSYVLEVSSPGLERPLKRVEDYTRFAGRLVQISTYAPQDGRKKFTGRLKGAGDGGVIIVVNEHEITVPWNNVAKARLAVEL